MAANTPTPIYNKISALLSDGRLREACVFMQNIRYTFPCANDFSQNAKMLQDELDVLLSDFVDGVDAQQRHDRYDQLYERAWKLCDNIGWIEHPSPYYEDSLYPLLADVRKNPSDDAMLGECFNHVIYVDEYTSHERDAIIQTLLDDQVPEYVRATLLSALTLHLTEKFDEEMTERIYIFTFDDQPLLLRIRAWVALVFVALIHEQRIAHLPRLREQYQLMCDSEPEMLRSLQLALLLCLEAMRTQKRIHEMIENIRVDDESDEATKDNVKNLFNLISEGSDLSYNSFAKVHHAMPFFSLEESHHHWLMPFSMEQPLIMQYFADMPKAVDACQKVMQSLMGTNTDKYLTVIMMMETGKFNILESIGNKLNQLEIELGQPDEEPTSFDARGYLQDLFRYCTLHPKPKKFRFNLFYRDLKFCRNTLLRPAMEDAKTLASLITYFLGKGDWLDAAQVCEKLGQVEARDGAISELTLLHLGTACLKSTEKNAFPERAIRALRKCLRLYPGSRRACRKLADLYDELQFYLEEQDVLQTTLALHPDDVGLLVRLGRSLNFQACYTDALEPLFKADVLHEGLRTVQHELALALFGTHDYERAGRYAHLAASHDDATPADHILCGHLALVQGSISQAMACYQKAPAKEVLVALTHDESLLTGAGLSLSDIDLVRQQLAKNQERNAPQPE